MPNISLIENDGTTLNVFTDQTFDFVLSTGVIQHIPLSVLIMKSEVSTGVAIKPQDIHELIWRTNCWNDLNSMKDHQNLQKKG